MTTTTAHAGVWHNLPPLLAGWQWDGHQTSAAYPPTAKLRAPDGWTTTEYAEGNASNQAIACALRYVHRQATALAIAEPTITGVPMMDQIEARETINAMRADLGQVDLSLSCFRQRALDFAEREGWRALGYSGALEAINAELGAQYSKSYLSRLLGAARIERILELPIGNSVPESQLRPLADLTPVQQQQAWNRAEQLAGEGKRTAAHVQQAVEEIRPPTDDTAFADARSCFAALGWRLERHGIFFKLVSPDDRRYVGNLAVHLDRLQELEAGRAKRAAQEARAGAINLPDGAPARGAPAIPPDIREEAARLGLVVEARDDGILLYWPDEFDDVDGVICPISEEEAREWLASDALTQYERRQAKRTEPPPAAAPAPRPCEHCGAVAVDHRNIGGVLAHRCADCAKAAEHLDAIDRAMATITATGKTIRPVAHGYEVADAYGCVVLSPDQLIARAKGLAPQADRPSLETRRQLVAVGAAILPDGRILPPKGSNETARAMSEDEAQAALARWTRAATELAAKMTGEHIHVRTYARTVLAKRLEVCGEVLLRLLAQALYREHRLVDVWNDELWRLRAFIGDRLFEELLAADEARALRMFGQPTATEAPQPAVESEPALLEIVDGLVAGVEERLRSGDLDGEELADLRAARRFGSGR